MTSSSIKLPWKPKRPGPLKPGWITPAGSEPFNRWRELATTFEQASTPLYPSLLRFYFCFGEGKNRPAASILSEHRTSPSLISFNKSSCMITLMACLARGLISALRMKTTWTATRSPSSRHTPFSLKLQRYHFFVCFSSVKKGHK